MKRAASRTLIFQSKFTSCKAIWIRKMVNNMNFHPWVAVANIILKDFGGANIFVSGTCHPFVTEF